MLWRRLPRLQSPRASLGVAVGRDAGLPSLESESESWPDRDRPSIARAWLLREDPDTPGGQRCRACAPQVRKLGVGHGYCPHLGRCGVASPADCRDRRARYDLRDSAWRIAGQRRPDYGRPFRLWPDAHLGAALRATLRWAAVVSPDGEFVRPGRCLGDHPHPQPSLQRPGGCGLSRRTGEHADQRIHRGADHRQRANGFRFRRHRRCLGGPAGDGPHGELCTPHSPATHRAPSHAAAKTVSNVDTGHRTPHGLPPGLCRPHAAGQKASWRAEDASQAGKRQPSTRGGKPLSLRLVHPFAADLLWQL